MDLLIALLILVFVVYLTKSLLWALIYIAAAFFVVWLWRQVNRRP